MNLYESIKLNLNESERKTKIIEKRKALKESSNELTPEEIVKDSYETIISNGKQPTLDNIIGDILDNYDQDYFKDNTMEDNIATSESVKYYLRHLGLDYIDEDFEDNQDKVNESNLNESDNKNEILSKIFARYPDISEEDEDFLNGLSYEDLIAEVKNRGWQDVLNESDNAELDKVRDIANEFVEYLRNNQIFAELISYDTVDYNGPMGKVVYGIEWGDWKHDHLASEELAKQFFGSNINIDDVVTEEDGSDTYSANHEVVFNLSDYDKWEDRYNSMSDSEEKEDKRKTSLEENAK